MQPFDALTIRAVLHEAKPLLLNRKVDKVYQLSRDEVILCLRSKAGMTNLLLSAQTAYGRICLIKVPSFVNQSDKSRSQNPSNFCLLLRRHLTGATLVGIEQPTGERMVDFVFSCTDEVGSASIKVLSAEIMGRHSNLIFWDRATEKILTASHVVTKEMSRQREVAPGLRFVRPPIQDKVSIFEISEEQFKERMAQLEVARQSDEAPHLVPATIEQWLLNICTGLGRHLAEEIVASCALPSQLAKSLEHPECTQLLWDKIYQMRKLEAFKPAMKLDLSRYTVASWWPDMSEKEWKVFAATNDLVEEYFRSVETREQFQQLRERLRSELRGEIERLETRISAAQEHVTAAHELAALKNSGDLILANLGQIELGMGDFTCQNLYGQNGGTVTIKLNPNLNGSQNAQTFYRQYAKSRARQGAAGAACDEARVRLTKVQAQMTALEQAQGSDELRRLKDTLIGRKQSELPRIPAQTHGGNNKKKPQKSKILSMTSSDGWTVYVGRNRQENDHLLGRLAQPNDLWLHILGQGGAHVLIRVPASKQEPPLNTIKEAAQAAARLSKAASGAKVRVVYTQCKNVKKISKENPGVVRYENEKTIEIDTAAPMPKCMRQLFNS